MDTSHTTYRVRKRCSGSVAHGQDTKSIQHCGLEDAEVVEQDDHMYTCRVKLSTLRVSPHDEQDIVKANRLAGQVKDFAASTPSLGSSVEEACDDVFLTGPDAPALGPSRSLLGDPVLYDEILPALCDRDVLNSTATAGGRCPNVPFGEKGQSTSVDACPAILVSAKEPIGEVCSTWRRRILNRDTWSTEVKESDAGADSVPGVAEVVGVEVDDDGKIHVDMGTYRHHLDDCAAKFCASRVGSERPHPLCRCVHRSLVPEYQLMQATSNGPDACWWKPCHDSHAPWALVPARLDPRKLKCPPVSCTNIIDMRDIYGTLVDIKNLSMYTNCEADELTRASGDSRPVDSEGKPDFDQWDKDRGLDPASGCPLEMDKLRECTQTFPGVTLQESKTKDSQCQVHSGLTRKLCEAWRASFVNQGWMIVVTVVVILFLSGAGAYLWVRSMSYKRQQTSTPAAQTEQERPTVQA